MKYKQLLQEAIGEMPEQFVEEAAAYRSHRRKAAVPLAAAACLAVLLLTGLPQQTAKAVVMEVKQIEYLSLEDALELEPLGKYLPAVLPDGYEWEDNGIYMQKSGTDVLSGVCFNAETGDTLTITAAIQSYFGVQTWNIIEPVRDGEQIGSQIYMDYGDFAVHYHSNSSQLSDLAGFDAMHFSAAIHRPTSGGFRMVSSDMYEPIHERSVLMHLSLDAEEEKVQQTIYPLSQTMMGSYTLDEHKMTVVLTDQNGGTYRFMYTVITRDLLVLEAIEYDDRAAYGAWIEAHVPLESVLYRYDIWSDTNLKENQY